MVRSGWARSAVLFTLLLAIAAPARADRDLVGMTLAKFAWSAASGDVVAYRIYVARNGGEFLPHPTTPIQYEGDRVVSVSGSYGDVIQVEVAALSSLDAPEGPRSDPSEQIRFVALADSPPPQTPPTDPSTPPTTPPTTPPPGSGPGAGGPGSKTSPDFNGDGRADLLLREGSSGSVVLWTMGAGGPTGSLRAGGVATSSAIVGNGDYNGDGNADLLSRDDTTGALAMQLLVSGAVVGGGQLPAPASPDWEVAASADFDGDRRDDLLLRNARKDQLEIWFMNGPEVLKRAPLRESNSSGWQVAGAADFDGDGRADILWYNAEKQRAVVSLIDSRPGIRKNVKLFKSNPGTDVVATGDTDGNGLPDVVIRDRATGLLHVQLTELYKGQPRADATHSLDSGALPASGDGSLAGFEVQSGGDFDGDKSIDLVLRNTATGDLRVWYLENAAVADEVRLIDPGKNWVFEGVGAESPSTHR